MLYTSFGLFISSLLINILVPLIPGLLISLTFFTKQLKGLSFWLVSWVLGIAVVIFPLFNIQFITQTLGRGYYAGLLIVLVVMWLLVLRYRKEGMKENVGHLIIRDNPYKQIQRDLHSQGWFAQLFFWLVVVVMIVFIIFAGIDSFSFPTFFDDAFGNWNKPAIQIFYDGGVKMFGELTEILGRGRLGYPIHIPLYKAQLATMMGGRYEMGIHVLNFLLFIVLIKLSFLRTREKTKNAIISILPALLIIGLPLVFFHITDSYMEFPSAVFSILTMRFLYRYLEEKELGNIVLALIFGALLAFTKNDGMIIYLSSIVLVFGATLLFSKQLGTFFRSLWKARGWCWGIIGVLVFCYLPFTALKMFYGLGYNQAQGESSGIGLSETLHWEIFQVYPQVFTTENNYNIVIMFFIVALVVFLWKWKKKGRESRFLFLIPLVMFAVITAVFLFTENYQWVLDQTTVNRVFTVIFIIFAFYIGLMLFDEESKKIRS